MEEIVGKLAGSVFQDSYIGMQIRTRVSPRNPQTNYQQLRRGEFGYISQLWRNLTSIEQMTWITEAGSVTEAIRLFIQRNVNLTLIEQALINSFSATATPNPFPIEISLLDGTVFEVVATGSLTTVPADTSVLFFATYEKAQTKIFTNPSQFSPITTFAAGTDLSNPVDVLAQWQARYGQIHNDLRLCIKTVAISNLNGSRSADSVFCYNEPVIATYYIIDADGSIIINSDGTFVTSQ